MSDTRGEEEIMYTKKDKKFEMNAYGTTLGKILGDRMVNFLLESMTKDGISKDVILRELRRKYFGIIIA